MSLKPVLKWTLGLKELDYPFWERLLGHKMIKSYHNAEELELWKANLVTTNYDVYQNQLAKLNWIQGIGGQWRLLQGQHGCAPLFFDSTNNYCRFLKKLTGIEPKLDDYLMSPNVNLPMLLYTWSSGACSLWPKSRCSIWEEKDGDDDKAKHYYPECITCRCMKCRQVCLQERLEADNNDVEDWPSIESSKEPSLSEPRRCECTRCQKLVLRDEYEVETIKSDMSSDQSLRYGSQRRHRRRPSSKGH